MSTTSYSGLGSPSREEILQHLQELLTDRRFAAAGRNASFLRYVVEQTLQGKENEIKETVIAAEVYGRSTDYDPKSDSIVRVEASRLRQKLRSYYEEEGRGSAIRFQLLTGCYVPQFQRMAEPAQPQPEPVTPERSPADEAPAEAARTSKAKPFAFAAGLAAAAALLSIPIARGKAIVDAPTTEAVSAWEEGMALLHQDPHTGQSEFGAPKTLVRAIERLEVAVAHSPDYARAWASLAEAYDYAFDFNGRDRAEDSRRAEAAARNAIRADQKLSAGHHMLALIMKGMKWDFAQAEVEYRRALLLDPKNAYAVIEYADLLRQTGRVRHAEAELRKARALLPAFPALAWKEAEVQLDLGLAETALATADSALQLNKTLLRAHVAAGAALERLGQPDQALARYEQALQANPTDRRALPAYGYLLGLTGQRDRALEVMGRLERLNTITRNCAFQLAVVHVGLGRENAALDWLERAWRTRQSHFPFAAVEYRFRGLHKNPRFRELLSRVGLKPIA